MQTETQEKKINVPMDLALRLSDWHSSMWDPVYAVSSSGIAKSPVSEERFRAALDNMEASSLHPAHVEHKQEIEEIVAAMKALLGEADAREAIILAMARYFWTDNWVWRAEDEGWDIPAGCEYTHIAPETHPEAVGYARGIAEQVEAFNDLPVEKLFERDGNGIDAYEFGGQLAAKCLGHDNDLPCYKTPYCESCDLWDLIPEPEDD